MTMKERIAFVAMFILVLTMTFSLTSSKSVNFAEAQKIPNHYIVVLKDNISNPSDVAKELASKHGLGLGFVYGHALKGFSADIPDGVVDKVKNDPRVRDVEQDQVVQAFGSDQVYQNSHENGQGKPASGGVTQPPQSLPTGVNRIDADLNPTGIVSGNVNVNIAIIDTGIDLKHPDLNKVNAVTCVIGTTSANDDNGHGTHVAGIAGAINNNIGVVGVAPGATLYAVKVLDKRGSGSISQVICGVDWVTSNAAAKNIKVANLSLGCQCNSQALHDAIIRSVTAGVTYAVAAGNSAIDVSGFQPASYPEVVAVSAIVDTDGKCGRQGSSTAYGADDSFASFSNFGQGVSFAAPGVNILSTYKGQSYATLSGTSMASPHVAGAAALYILNHPGSDPAAVKNGLLLTAIMPSQSCISNGNGGYTDGGKIGGPLVYAATS